MLGCVALAQVFARLAREMPDADGPYGYIRATLGDIPAFIALWCYWVSLWITNAAIATGVVGYLDAVFPNWRELQPIAVRARPAVVVRRRQPVRRAHAAARVQIVTTALKLLPMVAVAVLGVWLLLTDAVELTQPSADRRRSASATSMAASTIALFAMLGLESATVPAARVENPGRTIPRATMVGTLLTAVIYIIVSTVPMLLIPQQELAHSNAPFATADGPLRRQKAWAAGWRLFVVDQRPGRAQRLDAAGRRTDAHHGAATACCPRALAQQPPRRAGGGAARHRRAGQRHDPDELQQVAGRGLHLHHARS